MQSAILKATPVKKLVSPKCKTQPNMLQSRFLMSFLGILLEESSFYKDPA